MKRLFGLLLLVLCLSANSQDVAAVTFSDIKFGTKQMGDAQWNVSGCIYTTTCTSSAQNVGSMRMGNGVNFTLGATQYLKFSYTNTVAGEPWTITAYNANGTVATVLGTYRIINAGQGYFMTSNQVHPNAGNGTLWSTQSGMVSNSKTFTEILQPTQAQMDELANLYYSPDAIYVAGQTYSPPVVLAPIYVSGITTVQQARKTAAQTAYPNGHAAVVDIQGSDNEVTIQQVGGKGHFVNVSVSGNVNSVDILQTSTDTVSKHYMEATVVGGNNNLILQQRDTSKTQFVTVDGNLNSVTTNQKGTGNHYLDLKVIGNNHTAGIIQDGSGSHKATVELSGTQPWNFTLNQNSSTSQTYSLPHNMTDGATTSGACYTVGGCNLTINQQ